MRRKVNECKGFERQKETEEQKCLDIGNRIMLR
jgi:hypothetical protein